MPIGSEEQALAADFAGARWTPPSAPPTAAEFVRARYRRRGEAVADAAGVATLQLGAPPLGAWWLVGRLVVRSDSAAASEARVYIGSVSSTTVEDATPAGNLDTADYPQGLYIAGGALLIVEWTGATAGAVCYASAQVAELTSG